MQAADGPAASALPARLAAAVRRTALPRALLAAYLAAAHCQGLLPAPLAAAPPLLLLFTLSACLLAGTAALLGSVAWLAPAADEEPAFQLPARLRQFNILSMVPGVGPALAALSGYAKVARGVADDVTVFLFTYIVLVHVGGR